ncbi:hypothetical protein DMENIID0001_133230 [Sergentomyia squamirostris]
MPPPTKQRKANDGKQDSDHRVSLLYLNDDCLLSIFAYFDAYQLMNLERVCDRFQDLVQTSFKRIEILDFQSMRKASLKEYETFSASTILEIASNVGPYVRTLKINTTDFTCDGLIKPKIKILGELLNICPHVEYLSFLGFYCFSSELHSFLSQTIRKLKSLEMDLYGDAYDDVLCECLLMADQLEEISIKSVSSEVTGKFLKALRNLKKLSFGRIRSIRYTGNYENFENYQPSNFIEFCKNNRNLECLTIDHFKEFNDDCMNAIAKLTNLKQLHMKRVTYFNIMVRSRILGSLVNLTHLSWSRFTYELLDILSPYDRIEYLDLEDSDMDDNYFEILGKFTRLKVLKIHATFYDNNLLTALNLALVNTLEELHVPENWISDNVLYDFIVTHPRLKYVDITQNTLITTAFAKKVRDHFRERAQPLKIDAYGTGISVHFKKILREQRTDYETKRMNHFRFHRGDY